MTYSRDTRERAFLCALNWPMGVTPLGQLDGPIARGMVVAVKVGGRWRRGIAVSDKAVAWVSAVETAPAAAHLFDLHDGVRERMEREWGISSPPHTPPPGDIWDRVKVRRAPLDQHEAIILSPT